MLTAFLIIIGLVPLSYLIFSVYPAILIHCLEDSRCPKNTKDLLRMTYIPYLFKQKAKGEPY